MNSDSVLSRPSHFPNTFLNNSSAGEVHRQYGQFDNKLYFRSDCHLQLKYLIYICDCCVAVCFYYPMYGSCFLVKDTRPLGKVVFK